LHQFHNQVGAAILGFAAIEHPRDERVLQVGEYLALLLEARAGNYRIELLSDDLQRDPLVKIVRSHRFVHCPHPAPADLSNNPIVPEAFLEMRRVEGQQCCR
jgi:hypothetical protein